MRAGLRMIFVRMHVLHVQHFTVVFQHCGGGRDWGGEGVDKMVGLGDVRCVCQLGSEFG